MEARGEMRIAKRLEAQTRVVELIARGTPLDAVLEEIAALVERDFHGMRCSILLVDESGARLRVAAAPSLPAPFNRACENQPVGADLRALGLAHGLHGAAPVPVSSSAGALLGIFAMYYPEPREPGPAAREVLGVAASLASIAIERAGIDARKREAVERFELISKATNDVVWDWDLASDRVWWNDAYYASFGFRREDTRPDASSWYDFIHPEDREPTRRSIRAVIDGGGLAWQGEYRFRRADGGYATVFDRGFVVRDPFGEPLRMLGAMIDITERKRAEEKLAQLAQYDTLTGLPNRALFLDRLHQAIVRAKRGGWTSALAFIDLDRFKEINDSLGHAAGDAALRAAAARLRGCLREGDTVARLGGDEFTVILENLHRPDEAEALAQRMMSVLDRPMELDGREFFLTASIGIAMYPADGADVDTLVQRADMAMYQAKNEGRNTWKRFDAPMSEATRRRVTVEAELRHALERGELELHYQPIYRIGEGRMIGAEALLRWRHPERGLVPPLEFIPIAEASGLIVPIGEWVVREACREAAAWHAQGAPQLRVGVNFSARQFRKPGLLEVVAAALADAGLGGGALVLEITETLLMDRPEGVRKLLEALRGLGVRVVLDDFGTGYSSLAYLRHFPIDGLKIDRSFVRDVGVDAEDAKIVRAVIRLARDLRLQVTAEGVETEAQLEFLREQGCDYAQGWLYGKAEPAALFRKRLP